MNISKTLRYIDRSKQVRQRVERQAKGRLMRQGALVRGAARRTLKVGKRSSPPGQPPKVRRGGNYGLRDIRFAYNPRMRTVVVGPIIHPRGHRPSPAPHVHEFGGRTVLRRRGRRYGARYPKRPFMWPSLQRIAKDPRFMSVFKGMI